MPKSYSQSLRNINSGVPMIRTDGAFVIENHVTRHIFFQKTSILESDRWFDKSIETATVQLLKYIYDGIDKKNHIV